MRVTFLIGHMVKERDLILYELAEDLAKNGAEVTVVSGYPSRRISSEIRNYYLNNPFEQINERFLSIRVGTKKGEGNGLLERMIKYHFLTKAIIKKALTIPTDVYYIYSTPPFLGYHIKRLKKKAPVVYNAQDLFPDSLKVAKNFSEKNLLIRFFRKREKKVYRRADAIVTISDDMREHIIGLGGNPLKTYVINNWADTINIHPIFRKDNKLFDEFNISRDCFVVLYAGDIGIHQRLDVFLSVAKELKYIDVDIKFIFFGNGSYTQTLLEAIRENDLTNFYIFPLQSVDRISEVYSMGDIDIVSLEKGMTKIALPSKAWSIMSAGRPILGLLDKHSYIADMIDEKLGYIIDEMSIRDIAEVIVRCKKQKEHLDVMGQNAREYVIKNSNRHIQTKEYYKLMCSIVGNNK